MKFPAIDKSPPSSIPNRIIRLKEGTSMLFLGILLALLSATVLYIHHISPGLVEPGDGINHYHIAKYAWEHPTNFLDHWGKPLFTLLSAPFALMGFTGMIIFNILLFISASIFLAGSARSLGLSFNWTIPLLLFLSPVYYKMVLGGMTEILFGTLASATLYFIVQRKWTLAAILFSFILFTRPEAKVIFPFFALYFLWKSPKHLPFLLTGFIVYGFAGWPHYGTFFWFFTHSPYTGAAEIYGSGDLLHFVRSSKAILGNPFAVAYLIGIALWVLELFLDLRNARRKEATEKLLFWGLLVIVPAISILVTHSVLWWQGLKGSLGLIRVMATAIPFVALMILFAIDRIARYIEKTPLPFSIRNIAFYTLLGGLLLLSLINWNKEARIPVPISKPDRIVKKAAEWYKKQDHRATVFYLHPYFAFIAGLDPFDEAETIKLWSIDPKDPSNSLEKGDMIVWDAHFGPNEGGLPLQTLKKEKELKQVKSFLPEEKIRSMGGHEFGVYVFRKKASEN